MIVVAIIGIIAAIAIPNMIRSRMVANEAAAVGSCRAFANAQEIYRRTDWDSDGFREYARNIGPNGGVGNGESLYFSIVQNKAIEIVDVTFANAEGDPLTATIIPKQGYCFKIQLSANYPRAHSFVSGGTGLMMEYGLSAVPMQYDNSGLNKFQISTDGVVYQANQNDNVHNTVYDVDPANGWVSVE
jgi:type II secretory pathway pseudopilin PulG